MNKFSIIAATAFGAVSVLAAAPAYAEAPQGPRAEVIVGWDNFDGAPELNTDGVTYGIGLGYDYRIASNHSIGLDLEATDSDVNDKSSLGQSEELSMSAKRDLYVGGRYTYAAADKLNLFATVGYSNQRIGAKTSLGDSGNTNLDGVRLGAGVQYDLTDKLYWTTSYRYTNYEAGLERHQAVTGIGYRF